MPPRHYSFEFWALPKQIAESKTITAIDKLVLAVIITRYNGEAPLKMKQQTIAEYLGTTRQSVSISLLELQKQGYIVIEKKWKLNTYKIGKL